MTEPTTKRFQVTLPSDLAERLEQDSKKRHLSKSIIIRLVIEGYRPPIHQPIGQGHDTTTLFVTLPMIEYHAIEQLSQDSNYSKSHIITYALTAKYREEDSTHD